MASTACTHKKKVFLEDEPTWEELNLFNDNQVNQDVGDISISGKKSWLSNSQKLLLIVPLFLGVACFLLQGFPLKNGLGIMKTIPVPAETSTTNDPVLTTTKPLPLKVEPQQEVAKDVSELPGNTSVYNHAPAVALPQENEIPIAAVALPQESVIATVEVQPQKQNVVVETKGKKPLSIKHKHSRKAKVAVEKKEVTTEAVPVVTVTKLNY